MPKGRVIKSQEGEMPLPAGWDVARDFDGKIYFIDHNSHQTTWIDPRDRLTKPATFADCVGNELPIGWEQAYDPLIGVYYIDHNNQRTQIEDPHQSWRAYQEAMLRDYLNTASEELQAKKETLDVKMRRLGIAEDEYQHLNSALDGLHTASSTSSLSSTTSSRYDPDLLKQDVSLAKIRVHRLRQELEQIRQEVSTKQQGLTTLAQVEQKLSSGSCYTVGEAQAIISELRSIQCSLQSGEKERAELMQSLARHKEDLTRLQTVENSPDISTLSIPLERFSTASQTDLSGELVPLGARLAEMARLRLKYDENRKDVQQIQRRLSELEESVEPGEVESDKDRLLLFQEKEQLLRELRSICPKSRPLQEMAGIQNEMQRLETDLSLAADMAKRNIADRLRLHEEKQTLLHKLRDALNSMATLEGRLKSLSASTLSSSSSLASLSSSQASSKGSLSSLSFTDIYGAPSTQPDGINLGDLHRRVEILLQGSISSPPILSLASSNGEPSSSSLSINTSMTLLTAGPESSQAQALTSSAASQLQLIGTNSHPSLPSLSPRSSLSSVSPPVSPYDLCPPPSYEQAYIEKQLRLGGAAGTATPTGLRVEDLEETLTELYLSTDKRYEVEKSGSYSALPPLSPISEYVPNEDSNMEESQEDVSSRIPGSSSGTNTRSVSAAVSDESVAGDSGVFEASNNRLKPESGTLRDSTGESAQVQLKLRYSVSDSVLHVGIERARNLSSLFLPENHKVCFRIALLPAIPNVPCQFCTRFVKGEDKVTLGDDFPITLSLNKLFGKTLQINVFGVSPSGYDHCVGCAQVSLADFKPDSSSTRWYNILSFHFHQSETETSSPCAGIEIAPTQENVEDGNTNKSVSAQGNFHVKQESEISLSYASGRQTNLKEESSDESTIVSSQTSTLTRNHEAEGFHGENMDKWHQRAAEWRCAPEVLNESGDEDEEEGSSSQDDEEDFQVPIGEEDDYADVIYEEIPETEDKSTNTEGVFVQTKAHNRMKASFEKGSIVIKRSQTFSPSAVVNKREYVCRLNRSDSDSSMPLYRKVHLAETSGSSGSLAAGDEVNSNLSMGGKEIFTRGSMDRRSLRWKRSGSASSLQLPSHHKPKSTIPTVRTSIDLELDRRAQHCRLQALQDEISRLRILKEELEKAKAAGDSRRMNILLDDTRLQDLFQNLPPVMDQLHGSENLKMEKLLKKTSREIYKLRKSKTPRGKPDVISFKEKMAFFIHTPPPPISVPIESRDEFPGDSGSSRSGRSNGMTPINPSPLQDQIKKTDEKNENDRPPPPPYKGSPLPEYTYQERPLPAIPSEATRVITPTPKTRIDCVAHL